MKKVTFPCLICPEACRCRDLDWDRGHLRLVARYGTTANGTSENLLDGNPFTLCSLGNRHAVEILTLRVGQLGPEVAPVVAGLVHLGLQFAAALHTHVTDGSSCLFTD